MGVGQFEGAAAADFLSRPLPAQAFRRLRPSPLLSIGRRRRQGSGFCARVCAASDVTDVVVDRHSSRVGNPFDFRGGRGTLEGAVAAFDDLLRLAVAGHSFTDPKLLAAWCDGEGFGPSLGARVEAACARPGSGAAAAAYSSQATQSLLQGWRRVTAWSCIPTHRALTSSTLWRG